MHIKSRNYTVCTKISFVPTDMSITVLTLPLFLDCVFGELVGNGYCNDEANDAGCNYDGGDCCGTCANTESCLTCLCHLEAVPAIDNSCK